MASLPSVAPRVRLAGGVSGGLMDSGEIMPPVVWFLMSLGSHDCCVRLWPQTQSLQLRAVL